MTKDVDIQLDELKEIIGDFLVEADELISSLDGNLVELESAPGDVSLINEVFRAVHTIKGTSSFLGLAQITELTHRAEDVLNRLRKSELAVTPEIMDVLLESVDSLKGLVDDVRCGDGRVHDLSGILTKLSAVSGLGDEVTPATKTDQRSPLPEMEKHSERATATIRPTGEKTIRVSVERLDTLMNMMGELVLGRNSLMQSVNELNAGRAGDYDPERLNQASTAVSFITSELQMAVMKMRMQPIGRVFSKFPRLVRDLGRDHEKQIRLVLSGESTELDKSVIEEINDPLVHIVRTSCDHGLEGPEERAASGKPPTGTITLAASQQGSHILIRVDDDGRGLNTEAIVAKAVERGLVSEADRRAISDTEICNLVFEPGFSTAEKVTDVSGRGVGMDVVRTNIERLNGTVELNSRSGVGTAITIKLPLTLAIIQGLLVQSDNDVFVLPMSSVHETVKTTDVHIHYINQRPVFRLRDDVIPIIGLQDSLGLQKSRLTLTEKPYVVVAGQAEKKLGIMVDCFLGQEEVVVKSLGSYLGNSRGVSGATILGDGRIRLIIDVGGLYASAKRTGGMEPVQL